MAPSAHLTGAVGIVAAGALLGAVSMAATAVDRAAGAPPTSAAAVDAVDAVDAAAPAAPAGPPGPPGPAGVHPGAVPERAPPATPRWRWPLQPVPAVARDFRAPASQWGPGHRGLDLWAANGQEVRAVEGGVVTHAGVIAGRGTVSVRHPDGLVSTYEPVQPTVAMGDTVSVGEAVGVIRSPRTGSHCGALGCLHLGARRGGEYVDPLPLLAGGELVLLPLGR